jgi:tRNA/rRNA methyltransferase
VEPQLPENIGATARAMKTMGFNYLRLINPADHLSERARWMAHGSQEILEKADVFTELLSAINDLDLIIGTSARQRHISKRYISCSDLTGIIQKKKSLLKRVGLLFGREDRGLLNSEIKQCDLISTIPSAIRFPSLNLAQAVMVYAFSLSPLVSIASDSEETPYDPNTLRSFKKALNRFFQKNQISQKSSLYQQVIERVGILNENDIHILYAILKKINKPEDR